MSNFKTLKWAFGWLEQHIWDTPEEGLIAPSEQDRSAPATQDKERSTTCLHGCSRCTRMYSAAEPIAETSIRAGDASPNSHDQHTNAPRSHPSFSPNGVQVVTVNKEQAEVYALLITPELLDCLQNNISTFKNADSLDKQISYLEEGLDHAQNKLSETEECLAELLGHERTPEKDTVKATREEIEDLTQRKTSLQQWIMNFEDTLGQHRQEQFSANFAKKLHETTLYDLLRKPLQQSALLPPTQTVPPASGIDSFSIHLDNDNFEDETHSFFVHTQGYQQSQTSSEALRMELRVAIEEKQNEVEEYRHKLDTFPEIYAKNAAQFNENAANGIQQGSIETFDQWHFILKGDITRGLIKAEDELQLIKLQAHEAGVEHAFDDASIFQDDPDDGYAESLEDDMIRSAPYARIQGWRDSIPTNGREDIANTIPTCDGDDWEATPVEIGDSISCIGHEDQGRRIRRWEEMKLQIH